MAMLPRCVSNFRRLSKYANETIIDPKITRNIKRFQVLGVGGWASDRKWSHVVSGGGHASSPALRVDAEVCGKLRACRARCLACLQCSDASLGCCCSS